MLNMPGFLYLAFCNSIFTIMEECEIYRKKSRNIKLNLKRNVEKEKFKQWLAYVQRSADSTEHPCRYYGEEMVH